MKSCGFGCTRQTLISLNVMYIVVGLILIILPVYSKFSQLLTSWPIIGGAIASGVFLMLIAIAGIYGAVRHNQIILFFYMIILILIFILLFAFSCAALAISDKYEHTLLLNGWNNLDNETRGKWEKFGNCCGFEKESRSVARPCHGQTKSELPNCCKGKWSCEKCSPCYSYLVSHGLNTIKNGIGGVGMFFSFTLFVGVVMAFRYRHQKDPRANPSAFL